MPPSPGSRLLHYELTSLIGEGGMGRVFEARDTRLGRSVAVKVLPDALATDADRIARFEREAKVLASLNHSRIASLYGLEQAEGQHFLVMELVEGETIADRLRRGPVPPAEAVALSTQMAEALEAAHERGVVHRDLKPANVKVTPDGQVKVLDFGLAKALDQDPKTSRPQDLTASPTITTPAMTQAGIILGTAAYMSPEQAKGAEVDARSDIFSFGCVLYEMLTGRQAFTGESIAETLASVLLREPDLTLLPAQLNPRLRDVLRRCLDKNPKRRWQAAGDLRYELEGLASSAAAEPVDAETTAPSPRASGWRRLVPIAATALVVGAIAGALGWTLKPAPISSVTQFAVLAPQGTEFVAQERLVAGGVISPDGRALAFTARRPRQDSQLWIQRLDALAAQPLAGTEGASLPFWSPDSRFVAFFAKGKLQKIAVGGGPPIVLCDAPNGRGGTWNAEGTILFQPGGETSTLPATGLFRVSSAGGMAAPVTTAEPGSGGHRFPWFLPDGRRFLFHVNGKEASYWGALDTGEIHPLIEGTSSGAVYAAGHLLFVKSQVLFAQPFDTSSMTLSGEPVPIGQDVSGSFQGHLTFSVSDTGTLAYGLGRVQQRGLQQLVWVSREGKPLASVGAPGTFKGIDLSPDETRLVFHRDNGTGGDVWLMDLARGAESKLTNETARDHAGPAVWSRDGASVAYGTLRGTTSALHERPAPGTGSETRLLESDERATAMSWASGRGGLVFQRPRTNAFNDIWVLPFSNDTTPRPFQAAAANEQHPQVSPNGRWIAYVSNETGRPQVYLRSFPDGDAKHLVSPGLGGFPRWRGDGQELFYISGTEESSATGQGVVTAVSLREKGSAVELGQPVELFESQYSNPGPDAGGNYHTYAVSRDGQRFLIPRAASSGDTTQTMPNPIVVVLNWASTLGAR